MAITVVEPTPVSPAASTNTLIHTGAGREIVEVAVTNRASSTATIRVGVVPNGESLLDIHWRVYNEPLRVPQNLKSHKFVLASGTRIYAWSDTADVNFAVNGEAYS